MRSSIRNNITDLIEVDLPDAIQGPNTGEGNLVQKVCMVLHLRLLDEDYIYSRADLPGSGSKILSRLNQLPPVGHLGHHTPLHTATNAIH